MRALEVGGAYGVVRESRRVPFWLATLFHPYWWRILLSLAELLILHSTPPQSVTSAVGYFGGVSQLSVTFDPTRVNQLNLEAHLYRFIYQQTDPF